MDRTIALDTIVFRKTLRSSSRQTRKLSSKQSYGEYLNKSNEGTVASSTEEFIDLPRPWAALSARALLKFLIITSSSSASSARCN